MAKGLSPYSSHIGSNSKQFAALPVNNFRLHAAILVEGQGKRFMDQSTVGERRSAFLAFMAVLANVYLVAFAADAGLSLIEELFRAATGSQALLEARIILATMVVLGALIMVAVVLFVPHLPKLVFLPLIAFALWAGVGVPPLFPAEGDTITLILLVALQVALALAAFVINKHRTGTWFIAASRLPHLRHLGLRTAFAVMILFLLLPITIAGLTLAGTASYLEQETNGFVDFTTSEIKLSERIYQREDKRVVLVGMMHFGESDFYDTLFAEFPADALILAEGVTDRENRLSSNLSYQRLARVLGLEQQPVLEPTPALNDFESQVDEGTENAPEEAIDEAASAQPDSIRIAEVRPDVLYADADLADFSESTIAFLNETATIYDSPSAADAIDRILKLSEQYSEEEIEQVYEDIIYKRNDRLIIALDENLTRYDTIIIPWGAMHMPDLETALQDREFSQVSERDIPLIRYETIINSLRGRF